MRNAKYFMLVVLLIFSLPFYARAQKDLSMSLGDPDEIFIKGNQLYADGEYEKAANEYEKILQMGKQSGPVYYNLANSYFKTGKFGRAILNYERAERLMPRDADVKANYSFARSMVKDKIMPKKGIWAWKPFVRYYTSFTINELAWISSFFFILLFITLFLVLKGPFRARYKFTLMGIIILLLVLNAATVYYKSYSLGKDAIVVVPRADVFYAPFNSATKFFILHEGSGVTLLESKGEWDKVRRSDNKAGWVMKKTVEAI